MKIFFIYYFYKYIHFSGFIKKSSMDFKIRVKYVLLYEIIIKCVIIVFKEINIKTIIFYKLLVFQNSFQCHLIGFG